MTEDEARTKWCPFARQTHCTEAGVISAGQAVFNRLELPGGRSAIGPAATCIGSACMAWRQRWAYDYEKNAEKFDGYCGLAGAPQ